MKRMLDHLEVGLKELLLQAPHLSEKKDEKIHSEFIVLQKNLSKLPHIFFETDKDRVGALKQSVNDLYKKFIESKGAHSESPINFSE